MPEPVDILFLAPGLGTGGTERHLELLLPALRSAGFNPRIWNAGEEGWAASQLGRQGIPVERFSPPVAARQVHRLVRMVTSLVHLRPALVHSFLYGRHWLDALACRLTGTPYVGSRRNLAHWRRGPVLRREQWRDQVSAAIVAVSQGAAAVARREGVDPERLAVIPNGVPVPDWSNGERAVLRQRARAEWGLQPGARVVGWVGSLKPVKDPLTLLEGFACRCAAQESDRLVLIGSGPLALQLKTISAARGIAAQVILAGPKAAPDRWLPAFDLFALTSRAEGCSHALLEAMAAGLPVLATAVGGNREAVIPDETGQLVPPGDAAAVGRWIGRLLGQPEQRAALGRAGRERVRQRYGVDRMVAAHAGLYRDLAQNRRRTHGT
ncbi:MAG: glycosyltransferase [Acidobacteriota bacterium]